MKTQATSITAPPQPFDDLLRDWLKAAKTQAIADRADKLGIRHLAAVAYSLPPALRREHDAVLPGFADLTPSPPKHTAADDVVSVPMPLDDSLRNLVSKLRKQHGSCPVPAAALLKALTSNPVFVGTVAQALPFASVSETIHALDCYTALAEKLASKRFERPFLLGADHASVAGPFAHYQTSKTWVEARMKASSHTKSRVFPFDNPDFDSLAPSAQMACLRVLGSTIKSSPALGLVQLALTESPIAYPRNLHDAAETLGLLVEHGIASMLYQGGSPSHDEPFAAMAVASPIPGDGVSLSPQWRKLLVEALAEEPPTQLEIDCLAALGNEQLGTGTA